MIFCLVAAAAFAQTMLEHASVTGPAAAGATAGAAIGSKLNQTVGILGAAAQNGEAKTVTKPLPPAAVSAGQQNVVPNPGFFQSLPAGSGPSLTPPPAPAAHPAAAAAPAVAEQTQLIVPPARSAPAPAMTRDQLLAELAAIQPGQPRDAVLGKLGAPAYVISYDDGGRLVERLRFRAGTEDVVLVELKDGVVDSARSLVR